jgi:hypothetical protein
MGGNIQSIVMQLLFSFDRGTRVEKTLMKTLILVRPGLYYGEPNLGFAPPHCKPIKICTVPGHKCRWNPPILTIFTTRSIELHHLTIKRSFTTAELGDSLIYQAIFLIQTTSHQILCNNSVCNRVEYNVNVFSIRCTCSVNVDLFSIVQILIFEIFLNEITCVFEAMITCKIMEYIN